MQVPGFLLITLSVLSFLLLLIIITVAAIVLKNWIRMRQYEQIQPIKGHVLLNTSLSEADGMLQEETILPLLYPSAVQSYQMKRKSSLRERSLYDSVSSCASSQRSRVTVSTFDKRSAPFAYSLVNGGKSTDEKYLRSSSQLGRNMDLDTKNMQSPRAGSNTGSEFSHGSMHDLHEAPQETPLSVIDKLSFYSLDNTPELYYSSIYSHSELLQESIGESTLVIDPVISYDQDISPDDNSTGLGSLTFILKYQASEPELLITVKYAKDLPSMTGTANASVNSYVNLCIVPEDFLWKRTRIVENNRNPMFNETFQIKDVLYHKLREYTICFYVMDSHPVLGERPIGKILYPLSDLRSEQALNITKDLITP